MKTIIFFANSSWNILNFRLNLINYLIKQHFKIIIICPKDESCKTFKELNLEYYDISFIKNKISFFKDIRVAIKLFKFLKGVKPDYLISFTIKPNLYSSLSCFFLKTKNIINITGLGTMYLKSKISKFLFILLYKIITRISNYSLFQNQFDKKIIAKPHKKKYLLMPGSGIDVNYFAFSWEIVKRKRN